MPGTHTSEVEVTNISTHGFWILVGERELFLPYEEFPWFRDAPVSAIVRVELPSPHHLCWPDLDIDLAVESIEHPERFPLKSRFRSNCNVERRDSMKDLTTEQKQHPSEEEVLRLLYDVQVQYSRYLELAAPLVSGIEFDQPSPAQQYSWDSPLSVVIRS